MAQALTRNAFHSSRLVRLLTDMGSVEAAAPGAAFAEKLSLWVDYTDAIALCAVHSPGPAGVDGGAGAAATSRSTAARAAGPLPASACQAVADAFANLRSKLERAIHSSPLPDDVSGAFEPYRRYYLAHQHDMEDSVGPLRARVREVLLRATPALKQLATLDAALDGILCERESRLLSTLPMLLQRRFSCLMKAHHQQVSESATDDTRAPDEPARWLQAGGWLARFRQEMQTVLLAELDVRLQPTLGLLEALHHKTNNTP